MQHSLCFIPYQINFKVRLLLIYIVWALFIFILLLRCNIAFAQDSLPVTLKLSDSKKIKKRVQLVTAVNIAGYGGSLLLLNQAWYVNYPRSSFHTFNDSREWLQVDKVGHAWTAYNTGKISSEMWKWTGMDKKKASIIGGLSGAAYLTVIEVLDGYSKQWGWSWSDIGANIFGSGLFLGQELAWGEQRIQFKFSFQNKNYQDPLLKERTDKLFGSSWYERMLKDYNGQTYWLSVNLKSFLPQSKLPAWLNVAVGYGADGLLGGFENKWTDGDAGFPVNRMDVVRYRQWYLAPDIDFTKIKTKKKLIKALFYFLNAFKFPAPALELSKGKVKAHLLFGY
ncbi:MAG TPA: DUF2279 domain-containing protein [Chitinophagaceae bacterium]|nr:DUF2279 domain-containing protein [Chitinophagaceae bacterium]